MRVSFRALSRLKRKLFTGRATDKGATMWRRFANRRLRTRRQRLMAGLVTLVFVAGIVAPIFLSQRQAQAWWNSSWQYRRTITLNNSASAVNLTDFPIRVSLSSSNIDYANTQNSGQDLRFVASNDSTVLDYEIEVWNESGTSEVWVEVPLITAGSTTGFIYMYYGNTGASAGANPTGVWDSNYRSVWHLDEAGNGTVGEYEDSTSQANHGRGGNGTSANAPAQVAGKIGNGQDFSASDFIAATSTTTIDGTAPYTFETWIEPDTCGPGGNSALISKAFKPEWYMCGVSTNDLGLWYNDTNAEGYTGTNAVTMGQWQHIAGSMDSSGDVVFMVNGQVVTNADGNIGSRSNSASVVTIGSDSVATNDFNVDGRMDEPRISNVVRSVDWLEATYISGNNAMNSFGSEESYGGGPGGLLAWWDTNYLYRRKITINNSASSENLINFPLRVSLSTANSNVDYNKTQNSGQDIRFVDSDDTTVLDHDIELWNESGTSEVWVRVPQVDAGSTTDFIWMYYGNASASDGQNRASLWNTAGYRATWHMDENPAGSAPQLQDRSMSGAHATTSGAMTSGDSVAGKIATAVDFDGSNDAAVSSSLDLTSTNKVTVSYWYKPATTGGDKIHVEASNDYNGQSTAFLVYHNGSNVLEASIFGNVGYNAWLTSSTMTAGTWYHAVVVLDKSLASTEARTYLNGASNGSTSINSNNTNSYGNHPIYLAARGTSSLFANVVMDEVRISDQARSAEWAEAEYASSNNAMNTFGAEEVLPPDPPVLTAFATTVPLTPQFQLRSADRTDPNYLRYRIHVCTSSDCSSILRTIDQTVSQTGWSGQDAQTGSAYAASSTVTSSTLATHTYQVPALSYGTQYWWRAYAIDPGGSNQWSAASAIATFTTVSPPSPPVLESPINGQTGVDVAGPFRLRSTDNDSDYLRYKIDICSTSNCSAIVRTIDQTASQTGWVSQGANSGTAYVSAPLISDAQIAVHFYQPTLLAPNTQYWWRGYAIDPAGTNTFTAASAISTFTTGVPTVKVQGGTTIRGGTNIGQ